MYPAISMAWTTPEKDLLHIINMMSGRETAKERAHDDSPDSQHRKTRIVLDAVHGQPAVQGRAAAVRLRLGHALHHHRRPQGDRWLSRAVVRQCRPRPQGDRRRRRAPTDEPRLCAL